jgi:hypothetical protein
LGGRELPQGGRSGGDRDYTFFYQLTHITRDRGALTHDDRVDAVAHFQRAMMMDVDQAAKAMRDEEMLAEIEDFLEGFNQPTYRGMRVNGQRVATGPPSTGGPGIAAWMRSGYSEPPVVAQTGREITVKRFLEIVAAVLGMVAVIFTAAWYVFDLDSRVRQLEKQVHTLTVAPAIANSTEKTTLANPVAETCANLARRLLNMGGSADEFGDQNRKHIQSTMAALGCSAPNK